MFLTNGTLKTPQKSSGGLFLIKKSIFILFIFNFLSYILQYYLLHLTACHCPIGVSILTKMSDFTKIKIYCLVSLYALVLPSASFF